MKLTKAQRRRLVEICERPRVYNGRLERTLRALESRGLITVDWDLCLSALRVGGSYWRNTATATEKGRQVSREGEN